ncbi:MFS transporter [Alicyclobacillus herbarius]|uniref:MFS transporter n=1 Tax=Alicyclobacillus herbarius TaxID=122960 RepID=UPI0003FFE036|nr:MFS transporter [Alicyclobacillus herbarius]
MAVQVQEPAQTRINPWMVLSVTSLGVILVMLNLGALNAALPIVVAHFQAGAVAANWILLSYMLFNTVLILVFGQISDILGRSRLYLLGMAIFTAVSFLLGLSPNVWVLIALRCLQAAGGALIIANNTPLITDAFPRNKLGTGLAANVLVSAAAQLLGPVLGGWIGEAWGWQWMFWFNVPVGFLGLIWGAVVLRQAPRRVSGEQIDVAGIVLSFFSLTGLTLALSEGSVLGWVHLSVLLGFALFVVLTPWFLWHERHTRFPMIDLSLFRTTSYTMANVSTFLNAFARVSVVLLLALYFQSAFGMDAGTAGLAVLPVTVGVLLSSPIAGALTNRYSARVLSTLGLALSALGLALLAGLLHPHGAYWPLGGAMFLVGFGSGLFLTPNTKSIMMSVPDIHRGMANALRSMLQNMGQVLSTAITLMLVTAALPSRLQNAVYAGQGARLSMGDLVQITSGYRLALCALFLVTLVGIFCSYLRGSSPKG